MFTEVEYLIKEMIETISKIRQNRDTNSSAVKDQKQIIENEIQELINTCHVFLRLSLFALRLTMFVGLMHTFLC
jgi:hypothetical protein